MKSVGQIICKEPTTVKDDKTQGFNTLKTTRNTSKYINFGLTEIKMSFAVCRSEQHTTKKVNNY